MKSKDFVNRLKGIALNYKTLYVLGCIGAPLTRLNLTRYTTNLPYNGQAIRAAKIEAAAGQNPPVYGFDCVCLIKSVLWGWDADEGATYGGAKYLSNGVPDIDDSGMIAKCTDASTVGWDDMDPGEAVWMPGHIGVYIGDGLAVECTPAWKDGVQVTAVHNIGRKNGYNGRAWRKHGHLPYIDYSDIKKTTAKDSAAFKAFVRGVQGACGAAVDGVPGPETLRKAVQLATWLNHKHRAVKPLQTYLIALGYSCGAAGADGIFGAGTRAAVKTYQQAQGLSDDGIVGPKTWKKLFKL